MRFFATNTSGTVFTDAVAQLAMTDNSAPIGDADPVTPDQPGPEPWPI